MNKKYIYLFLTLIALCFDIKSQNRINYTPDIKSCYDLILQLRITEAETYLKTIQVNDPNNLATIHLENYIDFFVLFISESKSEFIKRLPHKEKRIKYLEAISLNDPQLDFIKAEILLQWALIHMKFDEKVKSGSNILEAYQLLERNKLRYPTFIENNKSLSIIHMLAESLPSSVRRIFSIKGSISLGRAEIESLVEHIKTNKNYLYKEEVIAIYSYILFYQLNQKDKAIKIIEQFDLNHNISPLLTFLKASMYLRTGYNDKALNVLNELKKDPRSMPFYYLDFMKGRSLLYKQDPEALAYLQSFVTNFKGRHFIKEAYQKMAWYELSINNNLAKYKSYMALCQSKGESLVDEDKQALREAKSNVNPNAILLKARILFDGGYFSKAQSVLIKNEILLSTLPSHKVEFEYRMGRIFQALKNYPEAINYLKNAINIGGKENYFAANSALQLGYIYEEIKQNKNAAVYYKKCLNINPPEYKESLHQKAKSGLQRVK
jgi:tetratricopeptide (TPR) repeat protein